jgi:8-oxo-dGTP diphosphatase
VAEELYQFRVGGALLEDEDGLLLVQNRRRNGRVDWTPPGGVIDATDASVLHGLTREVQEETGLIVESWSDPIYSVSAEAPGLGWHLRVDVHYAHLYSGALHVDDPDGIVVAAEYLDADAVAAKVEDSPLWVREPLLDWLARRWSSEDAPQYDYVVHGDRADALEVVRRS